MQEYKTLYRALGLPEWRLIHQQGRKRFCPSLLRQKVFYPSLTFDYACRLASEAFSRQEACEYAGLVCAFDVPPDFLTEYESLLRENAPADKLWLSPENAFAINNNLSGLLRIVEVYYGENFIMTYDLISLAINEKYV